jgi:hypothetical protein
MKDYAIKVTFEVGMDHFSDQLVDKMETALAGNKFDAELATSAWTTVEADATFKVSSSDEVSKIESDFKAHFPYTILEFKIKEWSDQEDLPKAEPAAS